MHVDTSIPTKRGGGGGKGEGGEKRGGRGEMGEGGRKREGRGERVEGGEKQRREGRKRGGRREKGEGGEEQKGRRDETRRCAYSRCPSCKLRPSNHEGEPTLLTRHCPLPQIVGPLGVYTSFSNTAYPSSRGLRGSRVSISPTKPIPPFQQVRTLHSCGPRRSRVSSRSRASWR